MLSMVTVFAYITLFYAILTLFSPAEYKKDNLKVTYLFFVLSCISLGIVFTGGRIKNFSYTKYAINYKKEDNNYNLKIITCKEIPFSSDYCTIQEELIFKKEEALNKVATLINNSKEEN
jgi:hypothetical protein